MGGQRKALIVANDQYEQDALRDLLAPAADAEALGQVLGDPQIGDFAVQVVRNEPAHIIQAQIEDLFSDSRSDDVLLLHFSGHGLKSESGDLFSLQPTRARTGLGYRPAGQLIDIGATSGVPTSSWIWACAVSGMSRGLPWYAWPL